MTEPQVATVRANGIDFTYLSYNPRGGEASTAPVVLCLHGYPDTPYAYDALAPRLAAAGYRVIAPYLRGYAPTGLAPDGRYGGLTLGEDVVALLDALNLDKARLVGHDWGAFAVYMACNTAPERIEQAVTLAIPHPRVLSHRNGLFKLRLFIKAWHFIFYRLRRIPEWWLARNDFAALDALWHRWSPSGPMPPGETDAVKEVFRQPGALSAALGYYRSLPLNPWGARFRALNAVLRRQTPVDTLALYGLDDGVLDASLFTESAQGFTVRYAFEGLPDCGHFLLRERPEAVCERILWFFGPVGSESER